MRILPCVGWSNAAECFRQENVCRQRWQLVRRAGLRPDMEAMQQVKEAIAAALESFEPLGKTIIV